MTTGAEMVLAPDSNGSAPRKEQILANSGATEAHNTTSLAPGKQATLLNSDKAAIRVAFRSAAGLSTVVSTSNVRIGANGRFDWEVESATAHVYIEAADGTSAYEAAVWQSSP